MTIEIIPYDVSFKVDNAVDGVNRHEEAEAKHVFINA